MSLFHKGEKNIVSSIIRNKIYECGDEGMMPTLKGSPILFWVSATGKGLETEKLPNYVLEWAHFDKIVKKANALGGKMYRGDTLAQQYGATLGMDIPHDCMEGFIARELLYALDGETVTRRSTYYSGILAWAGIVTVHKSQGKGSFITVNPEYRNI